ncbi:MAG TPA: hypothetical protein PLD82_06755 [Spirochaetota bacterium]|nr:hypothetical protein [Spirochaetota bacterium]
MVDGDIQFSDGVFALGKGDGFIGIEDTAGRKNTGPDKERPPACIGDAEDAA